MKKFTLIILVYLFGINGFAQTYNPEVEDIINEVQLDSLTYFLRNLSGEDSVFINSEKTIIEHRVSSWGNNLAADYIYETLEGFGLEPVFQDYSAEGKNVYAIQEGMVYPEQYYIVCAHYDAVDYHCADDNGSGSSAVLEAARILSSKTFDYSIIYALWDQEEIGLVGSTYYANQANLFNQDIQGVINMDMIAWDSDDDYELEIHTKNTANSDDLADYIFEINNIYDCGLNTRIENPGTIYSDQASFWNNNFASVLLIEEYYGGDFNPYYHTEQDRISICQLDYFLKASKLAIGATASLANPNDALGNELIIADADILIYPNPAIDIVNVKITSAKSTPINITLADALGNKIRNIQANLFGLNSQIKININDLRRGIYFINISRNNKVIREKLIIW